MAAAIAIRTNNPTRERIVSLWNDVSAFEHEPSMERLGYPPHLTFVIYEQAKTADLERTVRHVFKHQPPLRLTFDRISHFDGPPLVLWAAPRETAALFELHERIHSHLAPEGCHAHYRPETWVPHCTLGTEIRPDRREAAMRYAANMTTPFEVIFDAADWLTLPPVDVVDSLELSPLAQ